MKRSEGMKDLNPEQRLAVTTTDGYVLVLAGAGSGKTRVLTERIAFLIREKDVSPERILAFTFTNKAAQEMRSRVESLLRARELPLWIGTFHATGLKILRREAKYIGFANNFAVFDEDDSISLIKEIIKKKNFKLDEFSPKEVKWRISHWKNDLKERYARQFKYVLVDEFQDTNKMQMLMIDALSSHHHNLFVVGDDDQAIYGWRGATVENILQFDRVYKGTTVIKLEQNYRSTNTILRAANRLISFNESRKGKNLWSKRGTGEYIKIFYAADEIDESEKVREVIIDLIRNGFRRKDIAVLYRTHAQSRALENALRTAGLPYQIIGGVRFYERKEIKDILAYLRLLNNPMDDVSLRRIINVPKRGIGAVTMQRIEEAEGGKGLFNTIMDESFRKSLPSRQREMLEGFIDTIVSLRIKAKEMNVYDLMNLVVEKTSYREYLVLDQAKATERLENIDELLVEARRFVDSSEDKSLAAFLEEIALLSDIDTLKDEETVALMTLHNSKGLEFRAVLITGLEEGLLPHYSSFEDDEELEEERRLFYVGMTRAKEKLFLFSASSRMRYSGWIGNEPSRFLSELPEDCMETHGLRRVVQEFEDFHYAVQDRDVSSGKGRYAVGERIFHPSYGKGTIRGVEGSGKDLKVTVYFPGVGEKKFLALYAPFTFLD